MELSKLEQFMQTASDDVLVELAEITGLSTTTFVPGDSHRSAYNEGIRSIGLQLTLMTEKKPIEVNVSTYKKLFNQTKRN